MLDNQVRAFVDKCTPIRIERHFINFSRGVLAIGQCTIPPGPSFGLRIPSSWCEQKRWNDILTTLPPDLWMSLAMGSSCVVHDRSERPRPTRALWQGLSWIRFAVSSAWDLPVLNEYSRLGVKVTGYWAEQFHALPKATRNLMRYWLNYYKGDGNSVDLKPCETCEKGSRK